MRLPLFRGSERVRKADGNMFGPFATPVWEKCSDEDAIRALADALGYDLVIADALDGGVPTRRVEARKRQPEAADAAN